MLLIPLGQQKVDLCECQAGQGLIDPVKKRKEKDLG